MFFFCFVLFFVFCFVLFCFFVLFQNDRKRWGNDCLDPLPGEFKRFSTAS